MSAASLSCCASFADFTKPRRRLLALLLLATTALSMPATAHFPATIELSALNGTDGFRLDGIDNGDFAGGSVAAADLNGDGFDDVVIGARGADPLGRAFAGEAYVVFGAPSFTSALALSALDGTNGFRLDGTFSVDLAGGAVAAAGDVNGDGFEDILIGAYGAGGVGFTYVVFGHAGSYPSAMSLSALNGTNGFRLDGFAGGGESGRAVAGAGDINGDGFDDILIGARRADPGGVVNAGESYLVFGKASFPSALALSSLNGSNGFRLTGAAANDYSGTAVAGGGDFNKDGFDDILIGAPFADTAPPVARSFGSDSGEAYLVWGGPGPRPALFDLGVVGNTEGIRYTGSFDFDLAGSSLYGLGDVNGDSFKDLAIGAPYANYADDNGKAYVLFGVLTLGAILQDLADVDGTNGFALKGAGGDDRNGSSVAGGDVNGDGFDDLISGAPRANPGGARSEAGVTNVLFGRTGPLSAVVQASALNGINGFRINGAIASDNSGFSVATGDVNGDGVDDVIIGARGDVFGSGPGKVGVVFGRVPDEAVTRRGSVASQYITGGPLADRLFGLGGDDWLEGRFGPDLLNGGSGRWDIAGYAHAPARVTVNLSNPAVNTGDAAGDSYVGIEGIKGSPFNDLLIGNNLGNWIIGHKGNDDLRGLDGPDRLTGGQGLDRKTGGPGADLFVFRALTDSLPGTQRDRILDFEAGGPTTSVDRIDLRDIDAKASLPGNQAFTFIGTAPFSGVEGQLRVTLFGTSSLVRADVDGNKVSDLDILLQGFTDLANLAANDFLR
jgi:hypothetical protein